MVAHEFGHFIIAKVNGIHVVEFAVGMGPTLLSFEKNGTKYSLKLLPIGGACMFEGEDGREEATDGQNQDEQSSDSINEKGKYGKSFPEAPVFARIATVIAGPIFNFILAFFLSLFIVGSIGTDMPDETFRQYLLAKLALWTWDGTNKTVPEVLGIALPGSTQTDNGDGTVSISGAMMTERVYPVPAGIKIILRSP